MPSKTEVTNTPSHWRRIVQFPLTRVLLAILFVAVAVAIAQLIIGALGTLAPPASPLVLLLSVAIAALAVYGAYLAYVRLVEQRAAHELSGARAGAEFGVGALLGLGLFSTIVLILWLLGYYRVTGMNSWSVLIPALAANVPSGLIQEIVFRGVIFRIAEESLGTWWALLISVVLFGLAHIFVAQATLFSTVAIMVEAGILLSTAYMLTRRLWLPIGLHIAWDLANDGIFGVGSQGLAGTRLQGLFRAELTGPELFSGGAAGVEASLVTLVILVGVSIYMLWRAYHKGNFVKPIWRRAQEDTSAKNR